MKNELYYTSLIKSFELNKQYYKEGWFVNGECIIKETIYLKPCNFLEGEYNILLNSLNTNITNNIINECICENGNKYSMMTIKHMKNNPIKSEEIEVSIDLNKLINLIENEGYIDNNVKQKEICLKENNLVYGY